MIIGNVLFFDSLEQAELQKLWKAAFPEGKVTLCFNGLISHYDLSHSSGVGPGGGFSKSLQGSAFNARLELRWRQIKPGCFNTMILLEQENLVEKLTSQIEGSRTQKGFIVSTGRQESRDSQVMLFSKRDRRLPRPPEFNGLKLNYLYYRDAQSQKVRFIRLKAGEE
ncbi:MAG: hypothetical protein WCS37_16145 [Chloroflexota bacterium]|nr:hypothetical protein [Chloroflexota bacterium]